MSAANIAWCLAGFVVGFYLAAVGAARTHRSKAAEKALGQPQMAPIQVSSGDTLVVSYPHFLTKEQREQVKERVGQSFLDVGGVKVLILEGGMTVAQVLKK